VLRYILVVCRMFRVFGHEKVWVLNGGLPKWQDAGFPVVSHESQLESSIEAVAAVKKVYSGQQIPEVKFKATLQPHLVWSADQVRNNLQEKKYQLVDARGKARSGLFQCCFDNLHTVCYLNMLNSMFEFGLASSTL
jgi:3-mercaptopyruvate sulfurtransferase SseA